MAVTLTLPTISAHIGHTLQHASDTNAWVFVAVHAGMLTLPCLALWEECGILGAHRDAHSVCLCLVEPPYRVC